MSSVLVTSFSPSPPFPPPLEKYEYKPDPYGDIALEFFRKTAVQRDLTAVQTYNLNRDYRDLQVIMELKSTITISESELDAFHYPYYQKLAEELAKSSPDLQNPPLLVPKDIHYSISKYLDAASVNALAQASRKSRSLHASYLLKSKKLDTSQALADLRNEHQKLLARKIEEVAVERFIGFRDLSTTKDAITESLQIRLTEIGSRTPSSKTFEVTIESEFLSNKITISAKKFSKEIDIKSLVRYLPQLPPITLDTLQLPEILLKIEQNRRNRCTSALNRLVGSVKTIWSSVTSLFTF